MEVLANEEATRLLMPANIRIRVEMGSIECLFRLQPCKGAYVLEALQQVGTKRPLSQSHADSSASMAVLQFPQPYVKVRK